MEVTWSANEVRHKKIYWLDKLSLSEFEKYANDCDDIIVWYSNGMDDEIYKKYKELIYFVELDGYWKGKATSTIVDLTKSNEELLNGFDKTVRYDVRRAHKRDNLSYTFKTELSENELVEYERFYNRFSQERGLGKLDIEMVKALYKNHHFALAEIFDDNGELLVINGYIMDKELERVTLFTSCSLFRECKERARLIVRANRLLHYESMLYFKEKGIKEYDLGGVYLGEIDTEYNKAHIGISNFKRCLGGDVVTFESGFGLPIKEVRSIEKNIKLYKQQLLTNKVIIWGGDRFGRYTARRLQEENASICCVIDNKMFANDNRFVRKGVLNNCDVSNTIIAVTTVEKSWNEIKEEPICAEWVKNNKILYIRGE